MKKHTSNEFRPVYSTDTGRLCPECGAPIAGCTCKAAGKASVRGDGTVRVRRETKGRGGKTVTTITGLPLDDGALDTLCRELKRVCGCGGAVKDGVIEIQGDKTAPVMTELEKRGHKPKRAGG